MDDELGTLNHHSPENTVAASKEVKTGLRFGLNWALEQMDYAGGFREIMKHEIFKIQENMNDRNQIQVSGHLLTNEQDDRITFNTQTSTQWDGLRHWGFDDGRFYNGFTQKEILEIKSPKLGIHGENNSIRAVLVGLIYQSLGKARYCWAWCPY
jgi:hypothetical protein